MKPPLKSGVGRWGIGVVFPALLALSTIAVAAPAPRLVIEEPVFNFGERFADEPPVEHRFRLRNDGAVTLQVSVAETTCGCLVPDWTADSIRPGASAELPVRVNLRGRSGRQRHTVTLNTNDPAQPQATVTLEGVVRSEVDIEPMGALLGRIPPDAETATEIAIRFPAERPNRVLAARPDAAFLRAEVAERTPRREYAVTIRTVPPLATYAGARGDLRGYVRVDLERPLFPEIVIPFVAWTPAPPQVEPRELLLPAASATPLTRILMVRPGAAGALEIEGVETPLPEIQADVARAEGVGHRIRLTGLRPSALPPTAEVIIRARNAEGPVELRVPLRRLER